MSAETWNVVTGILTALGGGGIIVAACSSWLGKVWAERLMSKEKAEHEEKLAELRAKLEKANEESLSKLRTDLEIYRDTHLKGLSDKMASYRLVIDVTADAFADIIQALKQGHIDPASVDKFHRGRMKAFGYLSMLASQDVLDRFAELTDYVEDVAEGKSKFTALNLRKYTFEFVNAMRRDVGINPTDMKWGTDYSLPHKKL